MKKRHSLSCELIRHLFDYEAESGILRWKNPTANCMNAGDIAGSPSGVAGNQYIKVSVYRRLYAVHRIAWCWMTGEWPKDEIDHIDCNTFNNAWANLRESTRSGNCQNQRIRKSNASGFKGVHRHKSGGWVAQIHVGDGRRLYLGYFNSAEEASRTYIKAAAEYHGEFARAA